MMYYTKHYIFYPDSHSIPPNPPAEPDDVRPSSGRRAFATRPNATPSGAKPSHPISATFQRDLPKTNLKRSRQVISHSCT
ncbi:uncharacterized protein P884DRAFT_253224 [Thermothelomyces heterothallicus CBS 202.75]|uniref:uncharacterized protein n=1 Tax=Thermothelomyces heterothallicus CBS 202.75 TaxID=1149848 RepID=UPI0037434199